MKSSVLSPGLRYLPGVSTLQLDADKCNGCRVCQEVCPHGVFVIEDRKARIVDPDACIECGACALNCQPGALTVNAGVGCASAIIRGWLTGSEPTCDCGGAC
jgi:NAD-dependent dihydropyrimidine dehydrogenase PreA subunit